MQNDGVYDPYRRLVGKLCTDSNAGTPAVPSRTRRVGGDLLPEGSRHLQINDASVRRLGVERSTEQLR
jgi:hypothetical protein